MVANNQKEAPRGPKHDVLNIEFSSRDVAIDHAIKTTRFSQQVFKTMNVCVAADEIPLMEGHISTNVREALGKILVNNLRSLEKVNFTVYSKRRRRPVMTVVSANMFTEAFLQPLGRNHLTDLVMEGIILDGDVDGLFHNLRHQRALTTLELDGFTFLPERAPEQFPELLQAVSGIPNLKAFHLSGIFCGDVPVDALVPALIAMATKPGLEVLNLHCLRVPYSASKWIVPLFKALQLQRRSYLKELSITDPCRYSDPAQHGEDPEDGDAMDEDDEDDDRDDNDRDDDEDDGGEDDGDEEEDPNQKGDCSGDCQIFTAVADMLASNSCLEKLTLQAHEKSIFSEVSKPLQDALKRNNTLESLSFVISCEAEASLLEIPEDFGDFLESDNLTLQTLQLSRERFLSSDETFVQDKLETPAKTEFYLKLNREGRRPFLEEEINCEESWIDMLSKYEDEDDVGVLYYYLRLNPEIIGPRMILSSFRSGDEPSVKRRKTEC